MNAGAEASDLIQAPFRVRCGWGGDGLRTLAPHADVVVVVDVLSFTTCVAVARGRGAEIVPWDPQDGDPVAHAAQLGGSIRVAGPRSAEGLSLSPVSLQQLEPGERVLLPSPNGSTLLALGRRLGADTRTSCLIDAAEIAAELEDAGTIAVIAAGERWPQTGHTRFALEDWLGAGALVAQLRGSRSPEAAAAAAAWSAQDQVLETLSHTGSGRELIRRGFAEDVFLAAGASLPHRL